MYRVGYPFWKTLARNGVAVSFRIAVQYDKEASVFVATSPDLRGLVVEAATMEELLREANDVIEMLMEENLQGSVANAQPVYCGLGSAIAHA